jgi:HD-GYP domain-containing protein (c-di-GMP phosphodiesterase class II)
MSRDDAVAELRGNAGSQFEPRIVDALVRVLDDTEEVAETYGDAVRAVLAAGQQSAAALPLDPSLEPSASAS